MNSTQRGSHAEGIVKQYLIKKGYDILQQNWRFGRLEIDLICQKIDEVVFVEVRYRKSSDLLSPEDSVDERKQNRLVKAADAYLNKNLHHGECRFDIIAISGSGTNPEIRHYEDAFYPSF